MFDCLFQPVSFNGDGTIAKDDKKKKDATGDSKKKKKDIAAKKVKNFKEYCDGVRYELMDCETYLTKADKAELKEMMLKYAKVFS